MNSNGVYAEFAYQDDTSDLAGGDYDALYGHLKYTTKAGGATSSQLVSNISVRTLKLLLRQSTFSMASALLYG